MKKVFALITLVLLLSLTMVSAQIAQSEDELVAKIAGTKPGDTFYKLELRWDDLRLRFKTNDLERARFALDLAQQRTAEALALVNENKLTNIEEALNKRDEYIAQVEKSTDSKDINDETKEQLRTELKKSTEVLTKKIERFRTDSNPNNDRAIEALEKARANTEKSLGKVTNKIGTITKTQEQMDNDLKKEKENLRSMRNNPKISELIKQNLWSVVVVNE